MSFNEVMLRVLPPVDGHQPHITGVYGEQRASGPHGGTDFNYIGGQNGINLQNPKVYAPIAGTVTFTGGNYGTIKIKDADGNSHEILHTSSHMVSQGATVAAGDEIGTMGGKGPNGVTQYPRHVHYQMKGPNGNLISPEVWWSQQEAAASPAAAPASSPNEGPTPLMNFQYPFRKADGKQFTDAEDVYKALESEKSGHYLLGSNRFWHGGIHISDASAPQCVLNEPIRCMADGEVVAYRLNDDYLESTFGDNEKKLKYSNSFCLVRHEYKSAPNPEEGSNKGKQNTLNFYSLYMHLLPYQRYPLTPQEKPKPKITMKVGDFKAYDEAPLSSQIASPGKLANGTKLEIVDQKDVGNLTYAKGKILSGSVKNGSHKVRNVGREVWFAYMKDGDPYRNSKGDRIWVADAIPERTRPNYWQGKVKAQATKRLPIFQAPTDPTNGKPVGGPVAGNLELVANNCVANNESRQRSGRGF
ncbi:M23 family metallopeptidase [Pseudomonas sp. Ma2-10]